MKRYKNIFSILSVLIVGSIWTANTIRPLANPIVDDVQFSTFVHTQSTTAAALTTNTKQILAIQGVKHCSVGASNSISICYNANTINEQALLEGLQNILHDKLCRSSSAQVVSKCPIQKEWLNNYRACFNFLQPVFQLFNA
jgi:hypothetical protein